MLNFLSIISISVAIFWLVLIYAWVGYPLILVCLTRSRLNPAPPPNGCQPLRFACGDSQSEQSKPIAQESNSSVPFPSVSVLIAAYNEEKHIGARIENLLGLDWPDERTSIRIGIDGSADRTSEIAKQWASDHPNIQVYDFPERRGKVAILKDLVAESDQEVLVFTDANTAFKPDVLRRLISPLKDSFIGGVCGRLLLRGEEKEGVYWRWETRLKVMESSLDSCLGANGAIYAIRRSLFWENIPDNTIVDDFVIGMKIREQGWRMIYEPLALAEEDLPTVTQEWVRRVRIGAGDYQALRLCAKCLLLRHQRFAWIFWSHKVLRWFTPHILLILIILTIATIWILFFQRSESLFGVEPIYLITPGFLLVGISCALVGRFVRNVPSGKGPFSNFIRLCDHFMSMQTALFVGFIRFCQGDLRGYWKRTQRD